MTASCSSTRRSTVTRRKSIRGECWLSALNAFNAMSGTGADGARRLIVRTNSIDESNVLVGVQDSGTGIAAERLESIFDPFITSKP
jgi:C4-dicarboxylate-specific signal transduction histidine kinase